jgi:multidrug efflux pump subunit AcrA (membrane-fusion protein)
MKNRKLLSFFLLAASAVPLLHAQTPPPPPAPIPVVLAPWEKTVTLPAEAAPYFRVTLGTTATGWVDVVKADIGSLVKKGDLLAGIRAPELIAARDARAEEARAAEQGIIGATALLESAKAEAAAAESEFARLRQLSGAGTVTTKVSDESEARFAAAKAKVAAAEAGVASAKAEALAAAARATEAEVALEYTRIVAPYDGLVVARRAELGDFLATPAEGASLFTFEQTDPLRVRLHVPEHAAALTKASQAVTLKLGGREIKAELARVSGSLDPVTRTVTAEVDLSGSGLLPGTFGTATMTLAKLESATLLPLSVVKTEADGSRYVLVAGATGEKKVPVTLHTVEGLKAVLTGDLVAGQMVLP